MVGETGVMRRTGIISLLLAAVLLIATPSRVNAAGFVDAASIAPKTRLEIAGGSGPAIDVVVTYRCSLVGTSIDVHVDQLASESGLGDGDVSGEGGSDVNCDNRLHSVGVEVDGGYGFNLGKATATVTFVAPSGTPITPPLSRTIQVVP